MLSGPKFSVSRSGVKTGQGFKFKRAALAKVVIGASLIGLAGCEGILGGIQDPGSGSGCTLIVNILPVCGGEGGAAINSQPVKPQELLKEESNPSLAWLEALLKRVADNV